MTASPAEVSTVRTHASRREWTMSTLDGAVVSGHLPPWAEDDPSATDVPSERLGQRLADVVHSVSLGGVSLPVIEGNGPAQQAALMVSHIECRPYDENPALRVPVACVQIVNDVWLSGLDPHQLGQVVAALRAEVRRLEREVLPTLVAARADWGTATR